MAMRKMWLAAVLLILPAGLICADEQLNGKWVVVSMERDGKADDSMKGAVRENNGDKYSLAPKEGKAIAGTFKTDAKKSPATMDMMPGEGRYKGKTLLGIYEVSGDTLKVCFAEPGQDRPKDFTSKAGVVVVVHKKQK